MQASSRMNARFWRCAKNCEICDFSGLQACSRNATLQTCNTEIKHLVFPNLRNDLETHTVVPAVKFLVFSTRLQDFVLELRRSEKNSSTWRSLRELELRCLLSLLQSHQVVVPALLRIVFHLLTDVTEILEAVIKTGDRPNQRKAPDRGRNAATQQYSARVLWQPRLARKSMSIPPQDAVGRCERAKRESSKLIHGEEALFH